MELNFENVVRDYAQHYGNQLSASCFQVFCTIAQHTFIKWDDECLIDSNRLAESVGITKRTIMIAVKTLTDMSLIKYVPSMGGRGKKSLFAIDMETMQKLHSLETMQKKQCKKNSEKKGTIHGSEKPINISKRSVKESLQETPSALPSAPLPAVKHNRSSKPLPKKSSDEHKAFDAVYYIFKDIRGPFEPGVNGRQCKAIWELIEKAKIADPMSWVNLLERMVSEFHRIKTSKLKKDRFLGDRPFLPSELNSPGIWPRVLDSLRSTESKKPTAEDIRLRDLAADAIRG